MSFPTKENIATVMSGFEEFFERMKKAQAFNLQEFVDFMEPKFEAAVYRETSQLTSGNVLILTEGGGGDFISSTGAIREIRRLYPDACISLTAHPRTLELAEFCPYVDEVIFDHQNFPSPDISEIYKLNLQTAPKLLERRFDICFAFALHANTPLLMYMSGAKVRVTSFNNPNLYDVKNPNKPIGLLMRLATHLFPCSLYGGHYADDNFAILENMLHLPITNRKLEVWYTPLDLSIAKTHLKNATKPLYALCMGGSGQTKHYPPEKYARLLEMILSKEPTATFVILGGGEADLKSAAIIKEVAPNLYEKNIIDLTNKFGFRRSGALFSLCNMYIGNDTGNMLIATAAGCPVLSPNCFAADFPIYNTDIPRTFYPYGVPSVIVQPEHGLPECKNFHHPYGCAANFPHCITQIEPKTLFKGFKLLKERIAKKINEPLYIS